MFRLLTNAVFAIVLSFSVMASAQAQDAIDPAERDRVETIVRDYLLRNPEIILEAMKILEQRETAAAEERRQAAIGNLKPTLTASPLTPVFGAENGDVVIIEFFDYQCGYCKRLFPGLSSTMDEDENLTVVFVEFPILGPASLVAARAALAAKKQDLYMEYHTALMNHEGRLTEEVIFGQAEQLGLDMEQFHADMQGDDITQYLQMTRALADSLGIRGTPSMVIGDNFVGSYVPKEQLVQFIAAERADG